MTLSIRTVKMIDLKRVVDIESKAFQMSKEMTKKDMIGRIKNYPDTFLVAEVDGKVVGHVFGPASNDRYIKDELYFKNHLNDPQDKYQTILNLAVDEKYCKRGIVTALLRKMDEVVKSENRQVISLTCLPKLFSFYEKRGYKNEGKAADDIPDLDEVSSYNMVKEI